jgi:hypothetical protein
MSTPRIRSRTGFPSRSSTTRFIIVAGLSALGCSEPSLPAPGTAFRHQLESEARPWSHEAFEDTDGDFTFAIFSDLNGGERERIFEVAVEQLNLLGPEFIMSVGDLIDGGTEDRDRLAAEWDWFDDRAGRAAAPVFYVGGNHDLTNLTMREVWEERYGARYYHFLYKGVLFVILDTEDHEPARMREIYEARDTFIEMQAAGYGWEDLEETTYFNMPERTDGNVGEAQAAYVLQALADHPDVRWTFLFMHKPTWRSEADPEFLAIEEALAERPFTLFNGHLHTYSHTVRNGRDYIMLGTTGGSQNPESEMAFDHLTMVRMTGEGPVIANLRMDGILDGTGRIPIGGDTLCFQASACR